MGYLLKYCASHQAVVVLNLLTYSSTCASHQQRLRLLEPHPNDPGGSMPAVQGWTSPCTDGICRVDFSSMCYFFGRDIYDSLAKHDTPRPVGLIGTYWGGTADELWSSPEALKVRPTQLF